jgi:glucosamine kinase
MRRFRVEANPLLLGVDGGGTQCRARLCTASGKQLGEAVAGPANIRFGLEQSFSAVLHAAAECMRQAGLSSRDLSETIACLALAGASEPDELFAARAYGHPFRKAVVTTDAHAACVGAHGGRDGGVIIVGTGSIGWAEFHGRHHRVGGWGLPASDEGSGAWLGLEAARRVLWAADGRAPWSPVLETLFARFDRDPHAVARWTHEASPRDFASAAPDVVENALRHDAVAVELMRLAAGHIDAVAARLLALGTERLALVGGLAPFLEPMLSEHTRSHLVAPAGDALAGALQLARAAA